MPFKPGVSGNPAGRKPGTHRRSTPGFEQLLAEIRTDLRDGGNGCKDGKAVDPRDLLIAVVSHSGFDVAIRVQAASIAIAYERARKTARHISSAIDLPAPQTVEEATRNIGELAALGAAGKIGLDEAGDLISYQRAYIEARVGLDIEGRMTELRQIVERLQASARPVDAVVIGGLGPLRGTDVLMPALNRPVNGGEPEDAS
jgi:hypothetical protein